MTFEEMIRRASETNRSRIVLALDLEDPDPDALLERSSRILRESGEYVCAVKINRQLVLALGLRNGVDKLVKFAHELALPSIMDAKLNDVGHTNEFMLRSYIDAGFDAVIASPLVGWEGGLDSVFRLAKSTGKAVILLVYMSNPGADGLYSLRTMSAMGKPTQVFELLAEMAVEWKANGVIVGATKPEIISRVRQLAGREMAIFSPGVGAQGGDARRAVEAGSDYLIVGRSIYTDPIPSAAAKRYRDMAR
ncbi:MAG TPA: orotidine-5'-phosphate decarboxylase [Candidatus Acidoferrum sp.]|nr:orotidine-5'-phosphate decarboxylase [Candidatus Acidoferrum sp.]